MAVSEICFKKPNESGGVYRDPEFLKAYWELVISLSELIPDERSYGNLSLSGVASISRARCKSIVAKAKIMSDIMTAITVGRK